MITNYLKELLDKRYVYNNKGVTIKVIQDFEAEFKIKLPASYIEFLLLFGGDTGDLLKSYRMELNCYRGRIEGIKFTYEHSVPKIMINIEDTFFFIGDWQGYVYYFFKLDEGDTPPIYILYNFDEIIRHKDSFTEFLIEERDY